MIHADQFSIVISYLAVLEEFYLIFRQLVAFGVCFRYREPLCKFLTCSTLFCESAFIEHLVYLVNDATNLLGSHCLKLRVISKASLNERLHAHAIYSGFCCRELHMDITLWLEVAIVVHESEVFKHLVITRIDYLVAILIKNKVLIRIIVLFQI